MIVLLKLSLGSNDLVELPSVVDCNRKRACMVVRECLEKSVCSTFDNYFTIINHEKKTRNNECLLRLPKIRTEYARKSFIFMGVKVYNEFPIEISRTEDYEVFIKLLFITFYYVISLLTLICF